MSPLKAGDTAPKFSLPDQDGEEINLADFQGQRVLVYFYPKAMTPGCTVQACGLRDNMDELKKVGVEVLGISTDKPEKLSRFAPRMAVPTLSRASRRCGAPLLRRLRSGRPGFDGNGLCPSCPGCFCPTGGCRPAKTHRPAPLRR